VIYIAAVAMLLRFYNLPLKPLHHDEGVNTLLLSGLVNPPHTYAYDPANYHGPTLYYFAWLSVAALGLTTAAIRVVTALAGLLAVLLLLALKRHIGAVGALCAALLLALSPGAVYYSRYFIHEAPLVCFTLAGVVAAVWWVDSGRPKYLFAAAIAAALMFATKETWIIAAVVLLSAAAGAAFLQDLRLARRDDATTALWRQGAAILTRRARTGAGAFRQPRGLIPIVVALVLFLAVAAVFYTSLFSHWQGAVDALKTLAIWTKTGTRDHVRAWSSHLQWLWQEESPLLLLGATGAALALWRAENRFAMFAGLWSVGMVAAYSLIPYKTPWLTLNMTLPLAISGGYACDLAWRNRRRAPRVLPVIAMAAIIWLMGYQAITLSFVRYDDDRYPYVYAHTSREMLVLVEQIRNIQQQKPGTTIAVTSPDHFPLSWYLRGYRVGYYGRPQVTNDPVVIASDAQQATLEPALGDRYERVGTYILRPGAVLVLYVRRDLRLR
jgi:uncharacterized protein (TIGR03663 family)